MMTMNTLKEQGYDDKINFPIYAMYQSKGVKSAPGPKQPEEP